MVKYVLFGVEFAVDKDASMVTKMDLVEVIHVELPNKGGESIMPKVLRQYDFF